MGRRALRRIDPALDLSRHLRSLEELPRPLTAESLFGRPAPLEVEVGSGKGLFLASAATALPDHVFLGIELACKYAQHAAARLARAGASNAIVAQADALRVFADCTADAALSAVHVYFPDPWWKARHKKRRVMKAAFVRDVERTLSAGGALHFWTDVKEYFETTLELIAASTGLQGPFDVPERQAQHELDYRTHFERRMRVHGLSVFRCEFRKPAGG